MGAGHEERRRYPRRPVKFSVWFSGPDGEGYGPCWRYGEITDVSMGGARIRSADAETLRCGALLEILCLPEPGQDVAIDSPTVFRMHGRVIWREPLRGVVGIAHE